MRTDAPGNQQAVGPGREGWITVPRHRFRSFFICTESSRQARRPGEVAAILTIPAQVMRH